MASRGHAVVEGRFAFLNHEETFGELDWSRRHVSHLWSYNLHYFDYALDLARAFGATGEERYVRRFEELALGWVRGTDPGRGDGWEPYAIPLRVVNWIYALLLLGDAVRPEARKELEGSLAAQLPFLERRLEYHILANHLQKNFKALAVGGLFFQGPAAERWLRKGERGSWRELFEQVLPDGAQYERSPMYHAIATADYLELISLFRQAGRPVPPEAAVRVEAMVDAMGILTRPDGSLHLFNDAANGIAPERADVDALARAVLGRGVPSPEGLVALPDAGYWGVVDAAAGTRLLVDAGDPGPRYQPGHAHCDLLSFELDLAGRRFAVDAGVHGYDGDPYREYVRSTRAHNTVMIGDREQAEVWATFRMARRPRKITGRAVLDGAELRFEGSYRPYHHRRATHVRRIEGRAGRWRVTDRVDGAPGARLKSFLHLHPDWTVERAGGRLLARTRDAVGAGGSGAAVVAIQPFGMDALRIVEGEMDPVQGWHCPEFGKALPSPALELTVERNDGREAGWEIELLERNDG